MSLLILEIFARVYYFSPIALLPKWGRSVASFGEAGIHRASDNCGLVFELKPNLDTLYHLARFRTNSRGLRDKEYSLTKPPNTYRVSVLGDSFTMPDGVGIEDAYHSLLEDWFSANASGVIYEFINFGVSGYQLSHYLEVLKTRALAYSPDHVLVGVTLGNDLPKKNVEDRRCDYEVREPVNAYLKFWGPRLVKYKLIPRRPAERHEYDLAELDRLMSGFKELSVQHALEITFATVQCCRPYEFSLFEAAARKYGFPLIEAARELPRIGPLPIYRFDAHPNAQAHASFAKVIAESLVLD